MHRPGLRRLATPDIGQDRPITFAQLAVYDPKQVHVVLEYMIFRALDDD